MFERAQKTRTAIVPIMPTKLCASPTEIRRRYPRIAAANFCGRRQKLANTKELLISGDDPTRTQKLARLRRSAVFCGATNRVTENNDHSNVHYFLWRSSGGYRKQETEQGRLISEDGKTRGQKTTPTITPTNFCGPPTETRWPYSSVTPTNFCAGANKIRRPYFAVTASISGDGHGR